MRNLFVKFKNKIFNKILDVLGYAPVAKLKKKYGLVECIEDIPGVRKVYRTKDGGTVTLERTVTPSEVGNLETSNIKITKEGGQPLMRYKTDFHDINVRGMNRTYTPVMINTNPPKYNAKGERLEVPNIITTDVLNAGRNRLTGPIPITRWDFKQLPSSSWSKIGL